MITFIVYDKIFKTKPLFVVSCSRAQLNRGLMKHFKCSGREVKRRLRIKVQ